MGYCPGFVMKIGRFPILRNSPHIFTNHPESSWKFNCKIIGVVSGSLERFPTLAQIDPVQNMGYSPGFLLKIGGLRILRNSPQIFTNNPESSWKFICAHIGGISGRLERFPALFQIRHVGNHGKILGCGPWFWRWLILVRAGNRPKLPKNVAHMLANGFLTAHGFFPWAFWENFEGSEIGRFWATNLACPWFRKWRT